MEIAVVVISIAVVVVIIIRHHRITSRRNKVQDLSGELEMNKEAFGVAGPLVYNGEDLDFTDELLRKILIKHFPYFVKLIPPDQEKFLTRLKKFIHTKIFIIHDVKGYREMPILISAAAIQLTFGLGKYLMPHFSIIQVYPQEFIAMEPMRILIGNVSGNTINIAWKQFLEGYRNRFDNQNLGLHEMAHALYYQNLETDEYIDKGFKDSFHLFTSWGDKIYAMEQKVSIGLYTEYSMKSFQEFWAETIEIFFKHPERLKEHYPDLYQVICDLLCQDPLNYPNHNYAV
ncbi:MAG: zinc-dependent peptidase [Chitinophagaceae bacterium]|nr:zinc-dependent peptidase [Chitinophagaceae bacterium]